MLIFYLESVLGLLSEELWSLLGLDVSLSPQIPTE